MGGGAEVGEVSLAHLGEVGAPGGEGVGGEDLTARKLLGMGEGEAVVAESLP